VYTGAIDDEKDRIKRNTISTSASSIKNRYILDAEFSPLSNCIIFISRTYLGEELLECQYCYMTKCPVFYLKISFVNLPHNRSKQIDLDNSDNCSVYSYLCRRDLFE